MTPKEGRKGKYELKKKAQEKKRAQKESALMRKMLEAVENAKKRREFESK